MTARVLLLGHGFRGKQWVSEIERHREASLVGIVDPREVALEQAPRGVPTWTTFVDAIAETEPDVIVIATPPESHVQDCLAAIDAGIAVLCEKPLAKTSAEAREIVESGEEAGISVHVAQNFRFRPRETMLRAALAESLIGEPISCVVTSARPADTAPAAIRQVRLGAFMDIAIHHFDSFVARFGVLPERIEARARELPQEGSTYLVRAEYAGAMELVYRHSEAPPLFYYHEWIEGNRGAVACVDETARVFHPGKRPRSLRPPKGPAPEQLILDEILGRRKQDTALGIDARAVLPTMVFVDAVTRAIETGREVAPLDIAKAAGISI